jgi:hypothetical protein
MRPILYIQYLSSLWMSFEGQPSQYAMSHFNMLNNYHPYGCHLKGRELLWNEPVWYVVYLASLWMSFKTCACTCWGSIKNLLSVFLWAGGSVNKNNKSEQLTCSRDWRFCSSEL